MRYGAQSALYRLLPLPDTPLPRKRPQRAHGELGRGWSLRTRGEVARREAKTGRRGYGEEREEGRVRRGGEAGEAQEARTASAPEDARPESQL